VTHKHVLQVAAAAAAAGLVLAGVASPSQAESTAPEYVLAKGSGVTLTMLAAAGDKIGKYTLVGTPDGLGAYRNPNGTVTLLANHELSLTGPAKDRVNAWGGAGSFVSKLTIDPVTNSVTKGEELIKEIKWWNYATAKWGTKPTAPNGAALVDGYGTPNYTTGINRICSADLVPAGGFLHKAKVRTGKKTVTKTFGYEGAIYMTGEEGSDESRAFATNMDGETYQLPRMGNAGWENLLTAPKSGKSTVVMGNEDGSASDSQVWMYVGTKTDKGTWVDRAGLNNGSLHTMAIFGSDGKRLASDVDFRKAVGKGTSAKVTFPTVAWDQSGTAQNGAASRVGTTMSRVEDGVWDPQDPNVYWFVTTESSGQVTTPAPGTSYKRDGGALWKLTFADVANPSKGASIVMVLDGSESPFLNKPDNLTKSGSKIFIQEDPGGNDHLSRILAFDTVTGSISVVAQFNEEYFAPGAAKLITTDEESSGIIDVTKIWAKSGDKAKYFIFDAQVHAKPSVARPDLAAGMTDEQKLAFDNLVVEGGAIYLMKIDDLNAL